MTLHSKVHPLTGRPLHPLGITRTGKLIWPIMGGSQDAGAAAGTDTGGTDTTGSAGSTTDANSGKSDEGKGDAGKPERTFSQTDLDRTIADRLQRERAKFSDYDDLKAKAARADELEAAQGTETEKAVRNAKKEAETEVTTKFHGVLRGAEVRVVAAGMNFRDGDDALAHLSNRGVLAGIKVDADGVVDRDAVERELKALAEAKPYLLTEEKKELETPPAKAGVGVGGSTGKTRTDVKPGTDRMRAAYGTTSTSKDQ